MGKDLIENSDIFYIFETDNKIYGLEDTDSYTLIIRDGINKTEFLSDNIKSVFYMTEWFDKIQNCEIFCWECACLNRKFIIKEHVKLLMSTDLLKLRKNINSQVVYNKESLWQYYKNLVFTNQIIVNHKIVNYKAPSILYNKIINAEDLYSAEYAVDKEICEEKTFLHSMTDGVLLKDIKARYLKKLEENDKENI